MYEININEQYNYLINTLEMCGLHLLNQDEKIIGYKIFEEFDTGACSFLHNDNLERLVNEGYISVEIMEKSAELRNMFFNMQESNEWNVKSVKKSSEWRKLLELSDGILKMIKDWNS